MGVSSTVTSRVSSNSNITTALIGLIIILTTLSNVIGQTTNVGGKITSIGSSYSFPFVSMITVNDTDLITLVTGVFAGQMQTRWFWYRNQLNADFKTLQTSEVANHILNFPDATVNPVAVRTIKSNNYSVILYLTNNIFGQAINMKDPNDNTPQKFLISPGKDFDLSLAPLSHSKETSSFSVVYGATNTTHRCVFRSVFDDSLGGVPQTLFCPGLAASLNKTCLQAWTDRNDSDIFYITLAYPNDSLVTQKCKGVFSAGYNEISCRQINQVQLPQTITQSYGRLLPSGDIFIFVGTSDGSPIEVVAVDFVANTSSTITMPISIQDTRIISLEVSTNPNAVMMLIYDSSIPGFQVIDIVWDSATKNITYTAVSNFTSANMFTITGVDIPAASLSPSVFSIATASTDAASQVSTQFFGRRLCGDGMVILGEECDSVPYCDTLTCTCTNGVESFNVCKPPSTPATPSNGNTPAIVTPVNNETSQTGPNGRVPSDGVKIEVVVPAVVVPVVVVTAGVILLVMLLKRRKRKKNKSEISSSSEQNNFGPTSEKVKLEPVNYFSVPAASPSVLGKDSNTSTGSNMTDRTVANSLHGFDLTLDTIASASKQSNVVHSPMDDRMHIPYSELKFTREIGAGAYGKVFLGEWQKTNVALKISSVTASDEFVREAELIINLRPHPNVVQVLGMSSDGVNVVMIMEFCDGGSLDSLVFKKKPPMKDKIHFLSGIAKGIYHLHKNKIVHRDLAARNILLSRGEPKISDFGMSRKLQDATAHGTTKATVGPIRWMAPECLRTVQYSTKSDVWSFGILCWEVLSGEEPHLNSDPLSIGVAIRDQGMTPVMNNEWDPALQLLMKDCWKLDPDQRPDFDEICERLSLLDK